MGRMIVWVSEWVAGSLAAVIATVWAADSVLPETPTSVLVAFISVSLAAHGILGWVLKEVLSNNRTLGKNVGRQATELARIRQHLGLPEPKEGDDDDS